MMKREEKRAQLRAQREKLINALKKLYKDAFDELSLMDIEEGSIAKLSQTFLLSRQAAISHLEKEIEKPVITSSKKQQSIQ